MDEELLRAVKRLEESTNRTTYAVRALVRFVFIQLSATTIGTIAAAAASALQWAWLAWLAGSITTIGLFWASIAARAELRKSNPNR
ncbi:MAG: hypothetical protein ACKOWJ_01230 [Micrococcales bacterium]